MLLLRKTLQIIRIACAFKLRLFCVTDCREFVKEILHTGSVEMLQVLSTNTAVPSGLFARCARRNYQQDAGKQASGALRAKGLRRMAL